MDIKSPTIRPYDKDHFELVEDYELKLNSGYWVKVPKGYKTNGADIPRIFWRVLPPNSPEYLAAVIVHDYLCDKECYKIADEAMNDIMKAIGVTEWKRKAIHTAIRAYHKIRYGR